MWKVYLIRFIGFCLTPLAIFRQLIWLLTVYPCEPNAKLFSKPIKVPPAILNNKRWGEHKYIKLSNGIKIHYVEKGDPNRPLMLFLPVSYTHLTLPTKA